MRRTIESELIVSIAKRLMSVPTAPYHETAVRAEAIRICEDHELPYEFDDFGNLVVPWIKAGQRRHLVLAAHLDHPGFDIVRRLSPNSFEARFQGGVPDSYFQAGVRLRLIPGGDQARLGARREGEKLFAIHTTKPAISVPKFAVWDVVDFTEKSDKIYGRVCDDLIGVSAILATLIELKRSRARVNVVGILTRAEEVGFHGALAAAQARTLPLNALIVSLETSRVLPSVKMGGGVIIRVGDKTSIFDSAATRFLVEVANQLQKDRDDFGFQRALMSGGTCEATAFQEFGYQTTGVCVALGNYHNCGARHRIAPEFVNVGDVCRMVALLVEAGRQMPLYSTLVSKLPKRMKELARTAQSALRKRS